MVVTVNGGSRRFVLPQFATRTLAKIADWTKQRMTSRSLLLPSQDPDQIKLEAGYRFLSVFGIAFCSVAVIGPEDRSGGVHAVYGNASQPFPKPFHTELDENGLADLDDTLVTLLDEQDDQLTAVFATRGRADSWQAADMYITQASGGGSKSSSVDIKFPKLNPGHIDIAKALYELDHE